MQIVLAFRNITLTGKISYTSVAQAALFVQSPQTFIHNYIDWRVCGMSYE
jgi:hypothetical protein